MMNTNDLTRMGYIKLFRSVLNCGLYPSGREFTEFEAWMDLLLRANYAPSEIRVGLRTVMVGRGEIVCSLGNLATRWKWSVSKVRRFLERLEIGGEITKKSDKITGTTTDTATGTITDTTTGTTLTRVTICKYDDYQGLRHDSDTAAGTAQARQPARQPTISKEYKEDKEDKEENIYAGFDDFWKVYAKSAGSKSKTRSLWGKLSDLEKKKIMAGLPAYVGSFRDKQYQPYATTFLSGEYWKNESYGAGDVPGVIPIKEPYKDMPHYLWLKQNGYFQYDNDRGQWLPSEYWTNFPQLPENANVA